MAPRRVIEDSDEDDGSLYTPERMSPYTNTAEMANTLASSTGTCAVWKYPLRNTFAQAKGPLR